MKPKAHYSILKNTFILGAALASFPVAAQQLPADSIRSLQTKEVVVTATRSEIIRSQVPQSMEIISQRDIELTNGQEFADIIKRNSSVNIIQYPGLTAGVSVRGFRPQFSGLNQRTLLLVDGRPAGTVNIATINPANIERIEVLKGPASALYGSQAMGGVVNVITKQSRGDIRTSLSAQYGSFETFQATAASGGNITRKLDFDLSFLTFDRNKNFKLGSGNLFRDLLDAGEAEKNYTRASNYTGEPFVKVDDSRGDGQRRDYTRLGYNTGSLRLGYQLNDNWRVDLRGEKFVANNVETVSDIDKGNAQPGRKDVDRYNSELGITGNLNNHQLSLRGYLAEETSDTYNLYSGGAFIAPFRSYQSNNTWKGIQLKDVIQLGQHNIIAGIDYNEGTNKARSFNAAGEDTRPFNPNYSLISTGAYVQGQLNFFNNKLIINPGLRQDWIIFDIKETPLLTNFVPGRETNPFFSPSLAAQYRVIEPLTVYATIGRAFVTPDAYNVAGYSVSSSANGASMTYGNPDLQNENSLTWDAGLRFQQPESGFSADITHFSTIVRDRITQVVGRAPQAGEMLNGQPLLSTRTYTNVNRASIQGLELEMGYDFGALSDFNYMLRLLGAGTYNYKAEEVTVRTDNSRTYRDIYNVANLTVNYGLEYNNLKGLNLRLGGRYVGNRKDTDFNDAFSPEIQYPSFMVMDCSASYTYARKHTLTMFVNNLTDENYYEKRGYNMPGRTFTLRYGITL